MTSTTPRKGAASRAQVTPELLAQLENGTIEALTLAEELCVNYATLCKNCFPQIEQQYIEQIEALQSVGIVKRMQLMASVLTQALGAQAFSLCAGHTSNLIRGFACFILCAEKHTLAEYLTRMAPFANDSHYGVREWAWLILRPHLAASSQTLAESIRLLKPWTQSLEENIRRFACEILRPKGVWTPQIKEFLENPELCLPILTPLKADPTRYVQNSVANWLNDASKKQPEWVQNLCAQWLEESPCPATAYICKRALRTLQKTPGKKK